MDINQAKAIRYKLERIDEHNAMMKMLFDAEKTVNNGGSIQIFVSDSVDNTENIISFPKDIAIELLTTARLRYSEYEETLRAEIREM